MSSEAKTKARGRCPLCGESAQADHQPFCSRGCRDRDLLNWLGDAYRVPAGPAEAESENDGAGLDSKPEAYL